MCNNNQVKDECSSSFSFEDVLMQDLNFFTSTNCSSQHMKELSCLPAALAQAVTKPTNEITSDGETSCDANEVEQMALKREVNAGPSVAQGTCLTKFRIQDSKAYPCHQCGAVFARNYRLKLHMRIHTGEKPYKCEACGVAFNQGGSLKRHMRIHTGERPYACHYCEARFAEKGNLNDHVRYHTGEKRYKCPQCGVLFAIRTQLYSHMKTHGGLKSYQCSDCGADFSLYHRCRIHASKKILKCKFCHSTFTQRASLQRHMLIHSSEKLFKCEQCGASFTQNIQLNSHAKQVHGSESPHKCFMFVEKGTLKTRSITHFVCDKKPFQCNVCGMRFSQKAILQDHVHTHTREKPVIDSGNWIMSHLIRAAEKPYKCQECDATFVRKDKLLRHCRTHNGEKPFMCEICGAAFMQKRSLDDHARTQHAIFDATSDSSTLIDPKLSRSLKISIDSEFLQQWSTSNFGLSSCTSRWRIPITPSEEYLGLCAATTLVAHEDKLDMTSHCISKDNTILVSLDQFQQSSLASGCVHEATLQIETDTCKEELLSNDVSVISKLDGSPTVTQLDSSVNSVNILKSVKKSRDYNFQPANLVNVEETMEINRSSLKVMNSFTAARVSSHATKSVKPSNLTLQRRKRLKSVRAKWRGKAFQCKECGSTFARQCRLTLHMRIHTGEKPYVCEDCGAAFNQSGSLRRHLIVHTRKKPFTCADCDATFANNWHLQKHRLIHK